MSRLREFAVDIKRAIETAWVMTKYGARPVARRLLGYRSSAREEARSFRQALEKLGLTYVKLGQFLALRYDFLPSDVCQELNKLFDRVAPLAFAEVRRVIENALGQKLDRLFLSFEETPIASASVAQVHKAFTQDAQAVAVKVRRPGIEKTFAADIRNLRRAAAIADALGAFGSLSLKDVITEFAAWTSRELDFVQEGLTADRLRQNALSYEVIPKVFWDLVTKEVLTMEFIEGPTLVKLIDLLEAGRPDLVYKQVPRLDIELVGKRIAYAVLRQLFVSGFFHGDPHPGNLIIRNDNTVAFIDFGIYGELDERQREILEGHIENIAIGNIRESFRYYAMQYTPSPETNLIEFEREGIRILGNWYNASINPYASTTERHLATHGAEMLEVVRQNRLRLSMNTLLFWRALYTLDSVALQLSDYIDLMTQIKEFFYERRPGLLGRVVELLHVSKQNLAAMEFGRPLVTDTWTLMNDLSRGRQQWPVQTNGGRPSRRRRIRVGGTIALALAGASIAILTAIADRNGPLGLVAIALTVLLLLSPLFMLKKHS